MARHHHRRSVNVGRVDFPSPSQETQARSFDTEQQMRDALRIARDTSSRRFAERYLAERLGSLRALREIEDRRLHEYQKDGVLSGSYRRTDGSRAEIRRLPVRRDPLPNQRLYSPMRDFFRDPRRVLACIRRDIRRRVIFALQLSRKGGRGAKRFRKAHWTESSYIVCKRR